MSNSNPYSETDKNLIQSLVTAMSEVLEETLLEHDADNATRTCMAVDVCLTIAADFAQTHFNVKLQRGEFLELRDELQREITTTCKKHLVSLN